MPTKMTVEYVIESTGTVAEVTVTHGGEELRACIAKTFEAVSYPPAEGRCPVVLPLNTSGL
jgi:hypothetical protein